MRLGQAITGRKGLVTAVGRKRSTTKVLVAMAVAIVQPKGFGRIRLRRIDRDPAPCVTPFVPEAIEPGTQVRPGAHGWLGRLGCLSQ